MNRKALSVDDYKKAMRQLAFPVVVITTSDGKQMRGVTIGSLTSLSVDPPTLCFNLTTPSKMFEVIENATLFAVNMLAVEQKEVSNWFANPTVSSDEQMKKFPIILSDDGLPLIEGSSGYVICEITDRFLHSDHTVFFGKAIEWREGTGEPLVYFGGQYRELGKEL